MRVRALQQALHGITKTAAGTCGTDLTLSATLQYCPEPIGLAMDVAQAASRGKRVGCKPSWLRG